MSRISAARLALEALLAFACASCLAPPALIAADGVDLAARVREMPAGTKRVELRAADGSAMRGVYVPADPGAPLCLHLMGSSDTVASERFPQQPLLSQLRDLGVASLMVDYRGVGASDGERHVDHLEQDARVIWQEALRRVDGEERRLVLRCTSIGTVAAAQLLERGARPAAVVLIAPILPDTVVERYARVEHGWYGPWLARALFRPVADVDVLAALERARLPLLVSSSDEDRFMSSSERARMRACVEALPQGRWVDAVGGHYFAALQGRTLAPTEVELWRNTVGTRVDSLQRQVTWRVRMGEDAWRRIEQAPGGRERFEALAAQKADGDPRFFAAAVVAIADVDLARRLLWTLDGSYVLRRWYTRLDLAGCIDAFSVGGDEIDLPLATWVETLEQVLSARRCSSSLPVFEIELATVKASLNDPIREDSGYIEYGYTAGGETGEIRIDLSRTLDELRKVTDEQTARSVLVRLWLRLFDRPERVRQAPDGARVYEIWDAGGWAEYARRER
jgi:uncharacterized protein